MSLKDHMWTTCGEKEKKGNLSQMHSCQDRNGIIKVSTFVELSVFFLSTPTEAVRMSFLIRLHARLLIISNFQSDKPQSQKYYLKSSL